MSFFCSLTERGTVSLDAGDWPKYRTPSVRSECRIALYDQISRPRTPPAVTQMCIIVLNPSLTEEFLVDHFSHNTFTG